MNTKKEQLLIVCDNIKFLRKKAGYSKKRMAETLDVSVRTISMLERGIVPERLSCQLLFNAQAEFGINPTDLLKKRLL